MSRNATASWSGYTHQGKIGLLVALIKINSLHNSGENLEPYLLQYERYEDASISHNGVVLEVHQVKAKANDTTIGSYTDALEAFENIGTDKYLHTICEITNWANLTAIQNPRAVTRYVYPNANNFCSLTSIFTLIDQEIEILLNNANHQQANNPAYRELCYNEFLARLDDKIRYEHNFHAQAQYDITFTLAEVNDIFLTGQTLQQSKLFAIRQELFNVYMLFLSDMDRNAHNLSEEHENRVTKAIIDIYQLEDNRFIQFLKNINPHTTAGVKFETSITTGKFFSEDNFYNVFLLTIISVTNSEYNLDINTIPNYRKNAGYLVTAIVSGQARIEQHAKSILENVDVNFSAYQNDYIITENYTGLLHDHAYKIVERSGGTSFVRKNQMQFVPVQDAIDSLNN